MSNIFDLDQFKLQKDQQATRAWLDKFSVHLHGVAVEFPVYVNGLTALATAFQQYLDAYPTGSWWELAAVPSFGGDRGDDGLPLNILIHFCPGRTGVEPTNENLNKLRDLASLYMEPNPHQARFATHANLEPNLIYASWFRQCLLKYGKGSSAVQILLFRDILVEAYTNGMRTDSYSIEGDIFEITLIDRTSTVRLHLDFQHIKLTGDYLASLKPTDE